MARLGRLELPTYRFEVCRSIHLSYRRASTEESVANLGGCFGGFSPLLDLEADFLPNGLWQIGIYMTDAGGTTLHRVYGPRPLMQIACFPGTILFFQGSDGLDYRPGVLGQASTWPNPPAVNSMVDGDGPENAAAPILLQMQLVSSDHVQVDPPPQAQVTFGELAAKTEMKAY